MNRPTEEREREAVRFGASAGIMIGFGLAHIYNEMSWPNAWLGSIAMCAWIAYRSYRRGATP